MGAAYTSGRPTCQSTSKDLNVCMCMTDARHFEKVKGGERRVDMGESFLRNFRRINEADACRAASKLISRHRGSQDKNACG
jgi:hypothetical protein